MHSPPFKTLTLYFAGPQSNLSNKSLDTEVLSSDWQTTAVKLIHKKGFQHDFTSYRHVSLPFITNKITEASYLTAYSYI